MQREPRQLNVQQQNARTEQSLLKEAQYWREHGAPEALSICAKERGIQWDKSIVIQLEIDFPGMPDLFGILLTQNERFIRFEIELDNPPNSCQWEDITDKQNYHQHNRGIGIGSGAIAIEVLRKLNLTEHVRNHPE